MSLLTPYQVNPPEQAAIAAIETPLLLVFGRADCVHCRSRDDLLEQLLKDFPNLALLRIEDGPGRRLGRRFAVKLWPTVLLLRQGQELLRAVRPDDLAELKQAVAAQL